MPKSHKYLVSVPLDKLDFVKKRCEELGRELREDGKPLKVASYFRYILNEDKEQDELDKECGN